MRTLSLCALSEIHVVVRLHIKLFCVLSKILYGLGYALRLHALSLSWQAPVSPWAPLYLFLSKEKTWWWVPGPSYGIYSLRSAVSINVRSMYYLRVPRSHRTRSSNSLYVPQRTVLQIHVMVSAHAKSLCTFWNPRCGRIAHQVFWVLSKILYGNGYILRLCALSLSSQAPVSPWAPLYIFIPMFLGLNNVCYQGSVEIAPSCGARVSPWVTGQDLVTILGTWPYPLKGNFSIILSLRAPPWVWESRALTGTFSGYAALGNSRQTIPGATFLDW